jgi:hypothetical protein
MVALEDLLVPKGCNDETPPPPIDRLTAAVIHVEHSDDDHNTQTAMNQCHALRETDDNRLHGTCDENAAQLKKSTEGSCTAKGLSALPVTFGEDSTPPRQLTSVPADGSLTVNRSPMEDCGSDQLLTSRCSSWTVCNRITANSYRPMDRIAFPQHSECVASDAAGPSAAKPPTALVPSPPSAAAKKSTSRHPFEGHSWSGSTNDPSSSDRLAVSLFSIVVPVALMNAPTLPKYGAETLSTMDGLLAAPPSTELVSAMLSRASFAVTEEAQRSNDDAGAKVLNHYVLLDTVGQGTYGKVKLGYCLRRNVSVAIKIVRRTSKPGTSGLGRISDVRAAALRHEVAIMKKLRHRNIVSTLEVIDDPQEEKMYLVMEYLDCGSVGRVDASQITPRGNLRYHPMDPTKLVELARQVLSGLSYLHRHRILHRDIKPENILSDATGRYCIADFGVAACTFSGGGTQGAGTRHFMPPEGVADVSDELAPKGDMWALGVTIYALAVGALPQVDASTSAPPLPPAYRSLDALVHQLLSVDPRERPSARDAQEMLEAAVEGSDLSLSADDEACALTLVIR